MRKEMYRRVELAKKNLSALEEVSCHRCGGEGYLDREDWVETDEEGEKMCFSCKGAGVRKPALVDPMRVRYAVAYRLLPAVKAGDIRSIEQEETRIENDPGSIPYWPVLEDVFERAYLAAVKNRYSS